MTGDRAIDSMNRIGADRIAPQARIARTVATSPKGRGLKARADNRDRPETAVRINVRRVRSRRNPRRLRRALKSGAMLPCRRRRKAMGSAADAVGATVIGIAAGIRARNRKVLQRPPRQVCRCRRN